MMRKLSLILGLSLLLAAGGWMTWEKYRPNNFTQWEKHFKAKQEKKRKGIPGTKQARIKEVKKYFESLYTSLDGEKTLPQPGYRMIELEKAKARLASNNLKSGKAAKEINWVSRGPGNVGGRFRGLIVDPDDTSNLTWYAGSATGGVWKTTDGGKNWKNMTPNLPYLATTTLAMSKANTNVIYVGTGESFAGDVSGGGIFKSTDKGENWTALTATNSLEDFRYVNRLEIDPNDENLVLAVTGTGIFRTTDGGATWNKVYTSTFTIDDLVADPTDFARLYASVYSRGVLRSVDTGKTWTISSSGIQFESRRIELAVSLSNPQTIAASIETSGAAQIYTSSDYGENWNLFRDIEEKNINVLGGQGFYDNTIMFHPYSEDTLFVGGVDLWKIALNSSTVTEDGMITGFDTTNTASFLDFIPFNGNVLNGINTGDNEEATNLVKDDWVSVEIRFGPGIKQKAHRFIVPFQATSGVAASDYSYVDYVDVPFQVWDVTNNKQLMCSFRDQERDGKFNLYERASAEASAYGELGREYLFINSVAYDPAAPNANIAKAGGRSYKMIYFFWPTLAENGTWNADNLPESNLSIDYGYPVSRMGNLDNVADAYGQYGGPNRYDQLSGFGETVIPGFHPDHHELLPIPINETAGEFWILNSNDGGLGLSKDGGVTFEQIAKGLITTQFYHASKKPGAMEFIGGMQDNGTWQSPSAQNANVNSNYFFRYGGDGFGTIWNPKYDKLLLVSGYNNNIGYSKDGGLSFERKIGGIEIIEQNGSGIIDGPFLTKLEIIPSKPDTVFAIGRNGLYFTYDFTRHDWEFKFMGNGWNQFDVATSNHQVKVSIADNSVIWAGAGMMGSNWKLFVSQNYGETWSSVQPPSFSMPYLFSGFETHPTDKSTAYALYGAYGQPKILRTTNMGQTWEDISGVQSGVSNGFPDVACHSLFVFPNNTDRIWAGTEIGIFESMDNGATWNILDSDLPAVMVTDIFFQDDFIVATTYGRGIFTFGPDALSVKDIRSEKGSLAVYPNPSQGIFNLKLEDDNYQAAQIEIFDIQGKKVYSEKRESADLLEIDVRYKLNPGTYILNVTGANKYYTSKIIIE